MAFQEYACTGSKGYGRILLIKTNRKRSVKYSLEYKDGRWWIYDPPIPRVSREALIGYNDEMIRQMSDFVIEKGTKVQKEYYYNLINTNKMLKEKSDKKEF